MDKEDLRRAIDEWDEYTKAFIRSPLYVEGVSRAVKDARTTFRISIYLNVVLFVLGLALLVVAVIVGLFRRESLQGLGFAFFGSLDLAILFLSRPLDRIQNAMIGLTQAQVVWFGYMAQYDSLAKALIAVGKERPPNIEAILTLVDKMREATAQVLGGFQT